MYNKNAESMPQGQIRDIQLEGLKKTVQRVYSNSPYYKEKFDAVNIHPDDIKSLDDLQKLPFTEKSDLRDTYPYGMLSAPLSEITRLQASSGTTGKQTIDCYTKADIDAWAEIAARSLGCAEVDSESIVQVCYGYGLFTGGLGIHYGAERIGAMVMPMSSGNTERQLQMMADMGTTHIACTPSYASYLGEQISQNKELQKRIKLRNGILGAEPWSQELRENIESTLGITALDIYGLTEIMGPGVAMECSHKNGLHIWEDHFIVEIVDPDTLEAKADTQEGELVITTINKEGMPLIRYRTRDISKIYRTECACGRTHARIERVKARTDDMLIIKGVNVYPSRIESALLTIDGVKPHFEIIISRKGFLDDLEIKVELADDMKIDKISAIDAIEKQISRKLESAIGISSRIRLCEPGSITRFEGKSKRVTDLRKDN
ncbi:MAG: phenylacetate--CoA ligase [Eubacteriaceae bacterium]|nr:phenylacetate--CoA ligase [Eubacteriaceae bacterium]